MLPRSAVAVAAAAASPPLLPARPWPPPLVFSEDGGSVGGGGGDGGDGSDEDLQNWSSLIGIVTAICGNVLIALALNVQRYAHIRLQRKRTQIRERAKQSIKNAAAAAAAAAQAQATAGVYGGAGTSAGDGSGSGNGNGAGGANGGLVGGVSSSRSSIVDGARYSDDDARDSSETMPLARSFRSDASSRGEDDYDDADGGTKVASTYLKDPYWWLGQVLIMVGEMGNFLAYGFAPASIVSPLGVVALVSNCVIAPLLFKEVFRQRDFWGVLIAITGAVTVVLSAKTEETKLGPHEVWGAITTMEFEIYLGVSCALIVFLMWLSPRYGSRTILIDLGLVGLFGGYTALSTKGVSSMLSSTLFRAFTTPVTYVLVFILVFTAVMQVRYLNKALQRFDSTQVIPTQFVLFTLCVIIGSAVLYRDFERTTGEQAVKFVGGCLLTFFGVFLITSGRQPQDVSDEASLSDAEGVEETIGLVEQDPSGAPPDASVRPPRRRPGRVAGSSRASRSSRAGTSSRSIRVPSDASFSTSRLSTSASSHRPLRIDAGDPEHSSLLANPWEDYDDDTDGDDNGDDTATSSAARRPALGPHTISSDSIISVVPSIAGSGAGAGAATPASVQTAYHHPISAGTPNPTTPLPPRTSASASRLSLFASPSYSTSSLAAQTTAAYSAGGPVISPSPFSSTLSAAVVAAADKKRAGHARDGSLGATAVGAGVSASDPASRGGDGAGAGGCGDGRGV